MKKISVAFLFVFLSGFLFAQKFNKPKPTPVIKENHSLLKTDLQKIRLLEDTLHQLSNAFTYDTLLAVRQKSCYAFIPKLVAAIKFDNSFYFPFDSFETVSKIYSPDSLFRIFTWQLVLPKGHFRYYGLIQMRSAKLKMFPLYDLSDTMQYEPQLITTNENWYGALYYGIVQKQADTKTIYTIFGFEGADAITRRKVIEILTFDANGKPNFGAPLFIAKYDEDSTRYQRADTLSRFFIEYKYKAPTVMNYDRNLEMIVFDHVAPPNDKGKGATFSYVPDGTYEGFVWKNNYWNWVENVFTFGINENDNPPIPVPLYGEPNRQPELPK